MRKTKINIKFSSNITNENALSDLGEEKYLEMCESLMVALFKSHFNLDGESTEFKVEVEIAEE